MGDGSTPAGRSPGRASHLPARLNLTIAERFEAAAELLEQQAANPFRVRAWRQAAGELRFTVVTATAGPLAGRRVVRGRESECIEVYRPGRRGSPMPGLSVRPA